MEENNFVKKVAIVSCYFIHNYGSMLQAYATQKAVEKLGYDGETINVSGFIKQYRKDQYSYIIRQGMANGILRDRVGKAKNLLYKKFIRNDYTRSIRKRDNKFEEFANRYMHLSETYWSLEDLAQKCKDNYSQVMIGSDQLWLPANIAAGYYTLGFVPDGMNSTAYATSFGVSSLPDDMSKVAEGFLPRIRHISVREQTGQTLVKKLADRNVPIVCDPTLLFRGDEWMEIQDEKPFVNEPYIFCYFISTSPEHREFAKRLARELRLKIVAVVHVDCFVKADKGYADYTPYDVGPSEFLNLIRNAQYICTDSFHCSVFSILYEKEFFCFRRYKAGASQSTNSRLDTLFGHLKITGRMLTGNETIRDCISNKLDYVSIGEDLNKLRGVSYEYLKTALSDSGDTDL